MAISHETVARLAAALDASGEVTEEQIHRFCRYQRRVNHIASQIADIGKNPSIEVAGLGTTGGYSGGGKPYGQILLEGGVDTLDDFLGMTWKQVLEIPGIGEARARQLWHKLMNLDYNPDWCPPDEHN